MNWKPLPNGWKTVYVVFTFRQSVSETYGICETYEDARMLQEEAERLEGYNYFIRRDRVPIYLTF